MKFGIDYCFWQTNTIRQHGISNVVIGKKYDFILFLFEKIVFVKHDCF